MTAHNIAPRTKVLLMSMRHGYGIESRGDSYEWVQFFLSLQQQFDVAFFDFVVAYNNGGADSMFQGAMAVIEEHQPAIVIYVPYRNEFTHAHLLAIREKAKVLCFFHDEGWRPELVESLAPVVDAFTCTDKLRLVDYQKKWPHAVYFPFGVNTGLFKKSEHERNIDVSFIGSWHPYREWMLKNCEKAGFTVECYGYGWPNGSCDTPKMIDVFQRSKISLNLSNSISWDARYLISSLRALRNTIRSKKQFEQIKGRHFEIPATGALEISYYIDGLEDCFQLNQEIAIFRDKDDLIDKIRFYLENDQLRNEMANRGYERIQFEHDYCRKFYNIFLSLGWLVPVQVEPVHA